jgi:hypothetical protein
MVVEIIQFILIIICIAFSKTLAIKRIIESKIRNQVHVLTPTRAKWFLKDLQVSK